MTLRALKLIGQPERTPEQALLAQYEAVIERGLQSFWQVGMALKNIREQELYKKAGYKSFETYCQARWDMKSRYAYDLSGSAEVFNNIKLCANAHSLTGNNSQILPITEFQVRPLTKLNTTEEQVAAWKYAVEEAGGEQPTAAQVTAAVNIIISLREESGSKQDDSSGSAETATDTDEQAKETQHSADTPEDPQAENEASPADEEPAEDEPTDEEATPAGDDWGATDPPAEDDLPSTDLNEDADEEPEPPDATEAGASSEPEDNPEPEPEPETFVLPNVASRGLFIPTPAHIELIRSTSVAKFNEQKNDNIEWARWSWNPVTGCLHNCDYCYARDIAMRFYEQNFVPTFLPERLMAPHNTNIPTRAEYDMGWKNVFVCSMADLWGKWVPREIIELVMAEVIAAPQWNFLFLTKFPARYPEFEFPANAWIGTTVDRQHAVHRAEKAFADVKARGHQGIRWLSCEPMLEPLQFTSLEMFDWVVIGGSSKSTQTPESMPDFRWIADLVKQADDAGCKVYMKTNLGVHNSIRLREYPWDKT